MSDAMLIALGQKLEELNINMASCDSFDDEAAYGAIYDEHWRIREQINDLAAHTIEGMRIKARAAQIALQHDQAAECDARGSFVALSKSIACGLLSRSL